jgi:predicted ester cyclase
LLNNSLGQASLNSLFKNMQYTSFPAHEEGTIMGITLAGKHFKQFINM